MFNKLKSLPALAALAGGTILSIGLTSAPAQAACGTESLADLLNGKSVICGDKEFFDFGSYDFGLLNSGMSVEFSQAGLSHTVTYIFDQALVTGTYLPLYKISVLSPQSIINTTTDVTLTPGGVPALVTPSALLSQINPPPMAQYEAVLELQIAPGTTTVTSWSQTYTQTPGPLPILGAGAAFGFSRKLRSRIKSVV
jgi:hypothetical protein